ncbi:type I DNA topoisomerase [Candidatus Peregrinibacteria bacterium]|nr:type I DNA topoisomerase [Candidatus Peregrinibacteria bacterium]
MSTHLVIVESPAKAKTIKRFLGKDYLVEASMGHVRDLPSSTLAVDTEHDFEPEYEVPKEKLSVVKRLKAALNDADDLWIATDEDREGEAIGWHLTQVLKENPKTVKRIAFHEITESAIKAAVASPRTLNMKLVDAQQARRVLDRLVGYTLSPFLWKKVYRGLSAGRVQSVAVKIIVDREREIRAFITVEYWTITAQLETAKQESFTASLVRKGDQKIVPGTEAETKEILHALEGAAYRVASIDEKELKKTPPPPFTTSTLQQEAARKLGFSVKQTMAIAQQLYEGVSLGKGEGMMGLITYMRTDSVNLSQKALEDAKSVIEQQYGREYVLAQPRTYKTKSKGAQEAHEAIRPTELSHTPLSLKDTLDHQQLKLYTLIWNRTIATQMAAAELKRVGADIQALRSVSGQALPSGSGQGNYIFRATGQTVLFDGYLRVYQEGRDEGDVKKDDDVEDGEKLLPPLSQGETLFLQELKPEQHFTKPPPRYTEASLVKKPEEEGIGRPSTYAPTISTIQQRGYIKKEGKQLLPEAVAFTVTDLLAEHFTDIVDLAFTATMEQSLDDIAEGTITSPAFLRSFFCPFEKRVQEKTKEIQKKDVLKERILGKDPQSHGRRPHRPLRALRPARASGTSSQAQEREEDQAQERLAPQASLRRRGHARASPLAPLLPTRTRRPSRDSRHGTSRALRSLHQVRRDDGESGPDRPSPDYARGGGRLDRGSQAEAEPRDGSAAYARQGSHDRRRDPGEGGQVWSLHHRRHDERCAGQAARPPDDQLR